MQLAWTGPQPGVQAHIGRDICSALLVLMVLLDPTLVNESLWMSKINGRYSLFLYLDLTL